MNIFDSIIDLTDVPVEDWRTKYIGNGYRSCCYTTDNESNGRIILFGYDMNNNPQTFLCPHRSHIKYNVNYKTDELDMYGNYVETRYFNSSKQRKNYVESVKEAIRIVECDRPEIEFLHEMFDHNVLDNGFNTQKVRTFFFDIETEIGRTFEYPRTAGQRINMMTIYDTETEKLYTWGLDIANKNFSEDQLSDVKPDMCEYFNFRTETQLLEHFLDWLDDNRNDVWATWNGMSFDMPYLVRRLENVLGKREAKRISPTGRYTFRENNLENERANKSADLLVTIDGVFCADLLVLFRDKYKIVSPLDGGYSLDNVGEYLKLGRKVKYDGSLKDLYENNWQKFYEYNLMDVLLLKKIEDTCKMIPLTRMMTSFGLNNCESIYSSISYLTGLMSMYAKVKRNMIMVSYISKKPDPEPYPGAYVFDPVPGIYDGGVCCSDFNSLYPNCQYALNVSPETNIGHLNENWFADTSDESPEFSDINTFHLRVKNQKLLKYIVSLNIKKIAEENGIDIEDKERLRTFVIQNKVFLPKIGNIVELSRSDIDYLLENYCIITRNNDLFCKHEVKEGLLASCARFFFLRRKEIKKEIAKLDHSLYVHEITDEDEIKKTKIRIQNLTDAQQAVKICINSLYGLTASIYSPIYDVCISASTTKMGKFCNRNAALYAKKVFMERYNAPSDYKEVCSGDTDSIFMNIKCVSEKYAIENNLPLKIAKWDNEHKLKMWDIMETFVNDELTPHIQDMVTKWCHTSKAFALRYSLEYMADVGIYIAKKCYSVHKIVLEGRELADKIVYKGIELKKGNLSVEVKNILSPIFKNPLTEDYTEDDFKQYLYDSYEKFCTLNVDEISFWKGYNTEREAEGFLEMKKIVNEDGRTISTTAISAACAFYNQLLQKLNIGDKYESILIGDKCRFCYVKSNEFPIKYIAYKGRFPTEFYKYMAVDYDTMFDKTVMAPLKGLIKACKYNNIDPKKRIAESIDDW